MKNLSIRLLVAGLAVLACTGSVGQAQDDESRHEFRAALRGRNEVPLTLSGARGRLLLTVSDDDSSVHFVLSYEGLRTHVMFAHIHVGQRNVNGGVTVFFCDNSPQPQSPNPCPESAGVVEGDFTSDNVLAPNSQQLEAGNLAKLLGAIRRGQTYANVHTMTSQGGEIRGQIFPRHDDD